MYRINWTRRILLAALVSAVATSASISAAPHFLRARTIFDHCLTGGDALRRTGGARHTSARRHSRRSRRHRASTGD